MYQAVQFIELALGSDPEETVLGEFDDEVEAVESARSARVAFTSSERTEYAWWVVRQSGAQLANFIADSKSDKEFVLDLRTGELIELQS
jgi:hypothetical protein